MSKSGQCGFQESVTPTQKPCFRNLMFLLQNAAQYIYLAQWNQLYACGVAYFDSHAQFDKGSCWDNIFKSEILAMVLHRFWTAKWECDKCTYELRDSCTYAVLVSAVHNSCKIVHTQWKFQLYTRQNLQLFPLCLWAC